MNEDEQRAAARPASACVTCKPPKATQAWRRAELGFVCEACADRIPELLAEIAARYTLLSARPGGNGDLGHRGAPGFGSRSPAQDHVIAMRDRRSSSQAHVWLGGDGRVHTESTRPPLSVWLVLVTEATDVAERRELSALPGGAVPVLCEFLARHTDWWCHQPDVGIYFGRLRALARQLASVTRLEGEEPRSRPFARCPNTLDLGEHTRTCGGPLYPPQASSSIIGCAACGRDWDRPEWGRLGLLLRSA